MFYKRFFPRSFTTEPGDDIMPGLVPEGAKCGTNRVSILASYIIKYGST